MNVWFWLVVFFYQHCKFIFISSEIIHLFYSKENDWGFSHFIAWSVRITIYLLTVWKANSFRQTYFFMFIVFFMGSVIILFSRHIAVLQQNYQEYNKSNMWKFQCKSFQLVGKSLLKEQYWNGYHANFTNSPTGDLWRFKFVKIIVEIISQVGLPPLPSSQEVSFQIKIT